MVFLGLVYVAEVLLELEVWDNSEVLLRFTSFLVTCIGALRGYVAFCYFFS